MRFFIPDDNLIASIAAYATSTNNRLIVDIGCGNGGLIESIYEKYRIPVLGIEPYMMDQERRNNLLIRGIRIIPMRVEEIKNLIYNLKGNAILLFCRPCHSDFVENCLSFKHPETEALYITVPENLEKYDDLGDFMQKAKPIKLLGTSKDNEIIMSII